MKAPKGNAEKFYSYRLAMEKLKIATDHRFPLEAIAIEESIISDRLRAYVEYIGKLPKWDKCSCGRYLEIYKEELKERNLNTGAFSELHTDIKEWLNKRHKLIHGIVKTNKAGGIPMILAKDFDEEANKTAEDGREILKKIRKVLENPELSSKKE